MHEGKFFSVINPEQLKMSDFVYFIIFSVGLWKKRLVADNI